jgi:hypothetical protein
MRDLGGLISKKKNWTWWHTTVIPATTRSWSRLDWGEESETLSKKKKTEQGRIGRPAQVVEPLPQKCEVLSSNPSTAIKKKKCGLSHFRGTVDCVYF